MNPVALIGRVALALTSNFGGLGLILARTFSAIPRMDRRETMRSLYRFGYASLPLGVAVAAFVGSILVTQSGLYVRRYGAREVLGWAAGYAILREFGPLLVTLVMAGRIGARNAAELASLGIGGQLEGVRGAGIDLFRVLIAPRVVAATLAMTLVGLVCSLAAIAMGSVVGLGLLQVPLRTFYGAFHDYLSSADVIFGVVKDTAFGFAIAVVSTHTGLRARGGARAVGDASAAAVVWSAAVVSLLDFVVTDTLGKAM
jgi:phospholipid/cholesterol/gamma-HCH transport system permease protein